MQISAVIDQFSTAKTIACATQPPLTNQVYEQVKRLIHESGEIQGVKIGTKPGPEGLLLVLNTPTIQPSLKGSINQVLTAAEQVLASAEEAKKQREATQQAEKDAVVKAAAEVLGVPIQ